MPDSLILPVVLPPLWWPATPLAQALTLEFNGVESENWTQPLVEVQFNLLKLCLTQGFQMQALAQDYFIQALDAPRKDSVHSHSALEAVHSALAYPPPLVGPDSPLSNTADQWRLGDDGVVQAVETTIIPVCILFNG